MDNNFYAFDMADGGFRLDSAERLDELKKALDTSYDRYNQTGGQAMVPESLEKTLISTTFSERHLVFWNDIPKKKAYSTVEEYTTVDSYGTGAMGSGFFTGGGLPMETDQDVNRRYAMVKFLGTTRGITHPMTQVNALAGPAGLQANAAEEKEVLAGTRWLLRQLEYALYWSNAANIPQAINGIEAQIHGADMANVKLAMQDSYSNIIDMRGSYVTDETVNEAAQCIADHYGYPQKMYLSNQTLTDLSNYLAENKRVLLNGMGMNGANLGIPTRGFNSNFGEITYRNSVFLKNEDRVAPAAATHTKAPATPIVVGANPLCAAAAAGGGEVSKFVAADAGNYIYKVTAVNPYGESAPLTGAAVAVAAGNTVTLSVDFANGANVAWDADSHPDGISCYRVYRSTKGGTADTCKFILEVPVTLNAGVPAQTDIVDQNWFIPGTARAFIDDMSPDEAISTKILTPLLKWPLARIDTRIRFSLLLYLADVILYAPRKHVEIINIGRYVAP